MRAAICRATVSKSCFVMNAVLGTLAGWNIRIEQSGWAAASGWRVWQAIGSTFLWSACRFVIGFTLLLGNLFLQSGH